MYCRKWAAMLCGEMQKYVEKTPDLYFQFRNGGNHSLKENCRRFLPIFSLHGVLFQRSMLSRRKLRRPRTDRSTGRR
jgi:hypothetical protein